LAFPRHEKLDGVWSAIPRYTQETVSCMNYRQLTALKHVYPCVTRLHDPLRRE
jgi:hypothetical protein